MKVKYTTDLSRPGNDVYIYESITLLEQFDLYVVMKVFKVTGWSDHEDVNIILVTRNRAEAIKTYKENGGII
jgi:hypothetical protein